jgi:hypothetical protein
MDGLGELIDQTVPRAVAEVEVGPVVQLSPPPSPRTDAASAGRNRPEKPSRRHVQQNPNIGAWLQDQEFPRGVEPKSAPGGLCGS